MRSLRSLLALSILAMGVGGRASADEVPPFSEPDRPKPPPIAKPAPPPAVSASAEVRPPACAIELSFSFPLRDTVTTPRRDTRGQDLSVDATVRWDLGAGVDVGASLGYVAWRNYESAYVGATNHVVRAVALGRYTYGDGGFRPYAQAGLGVGLSVLSPSFTIYDRAGRGDMPGTTTIDGRVGPAYMYELAVGFRRALEGRLEAVGELALRGAVVRHHLGFTDAGGATDTQGVGVDELDARLGVAYAF